MASGKLNFSNQINIRNKKASLFNVLFPTMARRRAGTKKGQPRRFINLPSAAVFDWHDINEKDIFGESG